ncbi:MAG: hypothetical protein WCG27_05615 [Pseudomonadota bacterium]
MIWLAFVINLCHVHRMLHKLLLFVFLFSWPLALFATTFRYAQQLKLKSLPNGYEINFADGTRLCFLRTIPDSTCLAKDYLKIPVQKVATLSANQLAPFSLLGEIDRVAAHAQLNLAYRPDLNRQKVQELGYPPRLEKLLSLSTSIESPVILANGGPTISLEGLDRAATFGLTIVPFLDYQEKTPLARAEWLKLIGILLDKEKEAEKIFSVIEKN